MLLAVALFVSGVQFISMGLLGEIIAAPIMNRRTSNLRAVEVKSHRKELGDSTESTRPSAVRTLRRSPYKPICRGPPS